MYLDQLRFFSYYAREKVGFPFRHYLEVRGTSDGIFLPHRSYQASPWTHTSHFSYCRTAIFEKEPVFCANSGTKFFEGIPGQLFVLNHENPLAGQFWYLLDDIFSVGAKESSEGCVHYQRNLTPGNKRHRGYEREAENLSFACREFLPGW